MNKSNLRSGSTTRLGEVVSHSMISSQMACILTALAPQFVVILNGLIVSHSFGVECFKAISAINPISGIVLMLINSCCIGPSIQAGKACGELDTTKANSLFSLASLMACTIGALSALAFFVFRNGIAEVMTFDQNLRGYLVDYMVPVSLYLMLSAIACILNTFVTASGRVKKVTKAVIISGVMNVITIFILVKFLHLRVEAVGIAMCISALTNIILLLPLVLGKQFPFRFVARIPKLGSLVKNNISVWISVNSGSIADGFFVFLTNLVVLHFMSSDGLFIWGVCQMANNIMVLITAGIYEAYYYVDAFLMGEGDNIGRLKIARFLLSEITLVMVLAATVFTLLAKKFAILFGADTPQLVQSVIIPLICVVWFSAFKNILASFGSFSIHHRPAIKLSYDFLTVVITPVMASLAAILFGGKNLWFGFAITPLLLSAYVLILNNYYCRKERTLMPFYLFNRINNVVTLDVSIPYFEKNIQKELSRIRTFLNICEISETLAGKIELCCEELIVRARATHSTIGTFDLRMKDCKNSINIVVKSFGRSIPPGSCNNRIVEDFIQYGTIPNISELGMYCIIRSCDKIEYRYVYGMNVAYFCFYKRKETASQ